MSDAATSTKDPVAPPLTSLAASAGCAAKLAQRRLADVLRRLPRAARAPRDPRLLVDASTFDDAGVYRLRADVALVQTVDFFTPIVDGPFDFGRIAAANALSDVYAMGGRPITAMNLLGVVDALPAAAVARMLAGGAAVARAAGCPIVGGHTIRTAEPIYGLSVTGTVHPKRMMTNDRARPGDLLVLTKPLGTGIVTTAAKRGGATPAALRAAVRAMTTLNAVGADLAEAGLVRCATDVTGFGLLGHLGNVLRASGVAADLDAAAIPTLHRDVRPLIERGFVPGGTRGNLEASDGFVDWSEGVDDLTRVLLADAQTSGPLLLSVPSRRHADVIARLQKARTIAAATIGRIRRGRPGIRVR